VAKIILSTLHFSHLISFNKVDANEIENTIMVFEHNHRSSGGFQLLGTALFSYMLIIVLIITLAPFRYHIPEAFRLFWIWDLKEILQNIALFLPFGFLIYSIINPTQKYYLFKVFLFGLSLSALIEFNQLFIVTRMASLLDIATNAFGAFLGGYLYIVFKKRFVKTSLRRILEIPLMSLLFLMIPLLWLSSMAIGNQLQRIWLIAPLGLIGAVIISDVYKNRIYSKSNYGRIIFTLFYFIWFISGTFPALLQFPLTIFFISFLIWTLGVMRFLLQKQNALPDRRFEIKSLKMIAPIFGFYLIFLNRWPLKSFDISYNFVFVQNELFSNSDLVFIIRMIQVFSSFTIVGYMLYQYLKRRHRHYTVQKFIILLLVIALITELPRGFYPGQDAVFANIFFDFFWGLFGALIYILQLHYFKAIQNEHNQIQLELDFSTKSVRSNKVL
jgi:glycopeptide antibiotics resistance protein